MSYARFIILLAAVAMVSTGCIVEPVISDVSPRPEPITLRPADPTTHSDPEPEPEPDPLQRIPVDPPCDFQPCEESGQTLATSHGQVNSECQLNAQWSQSGGDNFNGGPFAGISPDGRLVVSSTEGFAWMDSGVIPNTQMTAFRATDGEPLFQIEPDALPLNADPRWQVRVQLEQRCTSSCDGVSGPDGDCEQRLVCSGMDLVAVPLLEAETIWRIELDNEIRRPWVAMSPSGARVVLSTCTGRTAEDQKTHLQVFDSLGGTQQAEMTIDGECISRFSLQGDHRMLSEHGRYLVVSEGYRPHNEIRIFDLAEGSERILDLSSDQPIAISNISFNHNFTKLLAVTGGEIRQWSFPALEGLPSITDVGVMALNRTSYMPMDVSPLAFSTDGVFMAHVNSDGQVVIIRNRDGQTIHTLEDLEFDANGANSWGNTGGEPIKLQFSPDGSGILVGYTGGLAHFRCEGAATPEGHDQLPVMLEGPETVLAGDGVSFTATHLGNVRTHGHAFFVNGELMTSPSTGRRVAWTFDEPGIYEVSVQVLDGLNTGEASLFVEVE